MEHITDISIKFRPRFKKFAKSLGIKLKCPPQGIIVIKPYMYDTIRYRMISYHDDFVDEASNNNLIHVILQYGSLENAYKDRFK